MKRPGGFDRGPEPPEPDTPVSSGAVSEGTPPLPSAGESEAAERLLARLRSRTATGTDSEAADLAPTIDLSSVREARDSAEAPDVPGEPDELAELAVAAAPDVALSPRSAVSPRQAVARWREARAAREADPVRAAERRVKAAGKQRRARIRRERQRFTLAARRRRRVWWTVAAAVGALLVSVLVGAFSPVMAVRDIQVVGAVSVDKDAVAQALSRFEGVPLALVDDAQVHRALEPFPLIQRYAVERTPPHTMIVRIEERVPVISLPEDAGVAQYDAAGVLLGVQDAAPVGVPLGSGAVADRSSAAFASAARALRDMPAELREQVVSVTASSAQDVTFELTSGVEVLWGDADQTRRKALVLTSMLGSLWEYPVEHVDVSSSEAPVFR